jgi:hypothetical protein
MMAELNPSAGLKREPEAARSGYSFPKVNGVGLTVDLEGDSPKIQNLISTIGSSLYGKSLPPPNPVANGTYDPKSQKLVLSRQDQSVEMVDMPLPTGSEVTIVRGRYLVVENSKSQNVVSGSNGQYTGFIMDLGRADKYQVTPVVYFGNPSGETTQGANHPSNIGAYHCQHVLFTELKTVERKAGFDDLGRTQSPTKLESGYTYLHSESGKSTIFFNPSGEPKIVGGNNWGAVTSVTKTGESEYVAKESDNKVWKVKIDLTAGRFSCQEIK